MSTFSYNDYTRATQAAANRTNSPKVGWFKLANDGDEAIVRFNISSVEDLKFATIHQLGASTRWMKVSCLNEFGSREEKCPLCKKVAAGDTSIGKASNRVYIEMLVSYKDRTTGQWSTPIPVVWDKPAGFAREIATKLQNFGDLKQNLFKITRNGAAGDMKTTYSMDYAVPAIFKPEMVPADFSAFENFKVNKHSYWEKSLEDVQTFLNTGSFPEVVKETEQPKTVQAVASTYQQPQAASQNFGFPSQPAQQQAAPQVQQQKPDTFSGFSF
jgi:hypothetical protein